MDERIETFSPEEMKNTAEQLLADPEKFECIPATTEPNETIKHLGPELQSIFTQFEVIKRRKSNLVLSRNLIAVHSMSWQETTWWQIGTDGKNMILTSPEQEGIFISRRNKLSELTTPQYKSVYEWIIWQALG